MSINLPEVITYVQRVTGSVFTDDQITEAFREGYYEFTRTTGLLFTRDTPAALQDVINTAIYALPADLYSVERVSYRGIKLPVLRSEELVPLDNLALETQGTVIGYMLDGDGVSWLRKYRIPAATDTDSRTAIEYIRRPMDLKFGLLNNVLEIPPFMTRYVEWYTIYRLLRRNGVAQDLQFSDHFHQRYLAGVKRTLERKSKFLSRRTGVLGGGPSTRGIPIGPRLPWEYGEVVR